MSLAIEALRQCRQTYLDAQKRAIPGGVDETLARAQIQAIDEGIACVVEAEAEGGLS